LKMSTERVKRCGVSKRFFVAVPPTTAVGFKDYD